MIAVKFDMFVDRPGVMRAIAAKRRKVLGQAGAYARTAMQRQIRAPKGSKKARTVTVGGVPCLVPIHGKVVDTRTGRPVAKHLADQARAAMAARWRDEGAGRPPRRGPTDLLRKNIFFGVDLPSESVVIGPRVFAKQPKLRGAKSVPELLNSGGVEIIMDRPVTYEPRPYIETVLPVAARKLAELVEKVPLR